MKIFLYLILALLVMGFQSPFAEADLIVTAQTGTIYETDGITTFGTTGAEMVGMTVMVEFDDLTTETVTWGTTGAGTGGAFGNGWEISLGPGTSWSNPFTIRHTRRGVRLSDLTLHGAPASVIFDRTFGGLEGTITSASGKDVLESGSSISDSQDITATYFDAIQFEGSSPVGDLYAGLHLHFGSGLRRRRTFGFVTDTDTGSANLTQAPPGVPEPSSYLMFAILGIGTGLRRKRRLI